MVIDKFFGPWPPENEIGGWLVQGHNASDIYDEFVVIGEWSGDHIPEDWIDWIRSPIVKSSALVTLHAGEMTANRKTRK